MKPTRAEPPPAPSLSSGLVGLPGVGPRTAERLAAAGLHTRADVLALIPRRWDDLRTVRAIGALTPGEAQVTRGTVVSARLVFGRRRFFEVVFGDDEGGRLTALWFYFRGGMKERFAPGRRFLLVGTPRISRAGKAGLTIAHPETVLEPGGDGDSDDVRRAPEAPPGAGIRARYPEVEDVPGTVVSRLTEVVAALHAHEVVDGLPAAIRAAHGFPSQGEALARLHHVDASATAAEIEELNRGADPAQRRLAFDELFFLQLHLAERRAARLADAADPCPQSPEAASALAGFFASLGFSPTAAQLRAVDEIAADLAQLHPMHRLLQGDVGSGKTVVMYAAAELAMSAGAQVAVMAPTEILAEQHARTLGPWALAGGRRLALLTSSTPRAERERTLAALAGAGAGAAADRGAARRIDLVVGTHALLAERVRFGRLGLVVVDEQHRFGVAQRALLRDKGVGDALPHLLVMTATPIPRTLALTVYGELDLSTLDEMPPGRLAPTTELHVGAAGRKKAHARLARALVAGRQGFVVCPRIAATEAGEGGQDGQGGDDDAGSALATHERLVAAMPGVAIGVVHGGLPKPERDDVMRRFRDGLLQLLVATTVIEVGVDVPAADVMLIEGAERFGLAQLHQLRGRIGRGGQRSLCMLVCAAPSAKGAGETADAAARLDVMTRSSDGFVVAEEDLRLRGPGEVYGTRQAGLPGLRFADLSRDLDLLRLARRDAFALLDADPALAGHPATRAVLAQRIESGALSSPRGG